MGHREFFYFVAEGVVEAHLCETKEFLFVEAHAAGVFVFVEEGGVEHGGIVGGENDWNAVAKECGEGMVLDANVRAAQLKREGPGADVALRTNFERDAAVGEEIHQRGIVDGGDSVADAFGAEEFDGFANFLRATHFSGVDKAMQAECGGLVIDRAKFFGGHAELVAADAEGDDGFGGALAGGFDNTGGGFGAELADGVKNIVDAQSPACEWFGGTKDGFKVGFGALLAEKHDADGKSDFGVDDMLGEKLFAIPFSAFDYDVEKNEYELDVAKERLKAAPGFDPDKWPSMADEKWNRDVYKYYERPPYWE